jgi:hypothetical protein
MKIIKIKNHLTIVLQDGSVLTHSECTDELYNQIIEHQNDETKVKELIIPVFQSKVEEVEIKTKLAIIAINSPM